jgi:citrate synthase
MPSSMTTSIGTSSRDAITIQGFDLCDDLIGHVDFGSVAYLLVAGRLPTANEGQLFNAILVSLADHGLTPSALAARLTYTGAPEAVQGAIASGLLGAGSVFLGVFEDSARLLQESLGPRVECNDGTLRSLALTIVRDHVNRGVRIPGIGHPIHKSGDPRTARLFGLADELRLTGPHVRLLRLIHETAAEDLGKELPINAAGACGALLSDLGFHWSIARGYAVLSRAAGLVGHVWEESQRPLGRQVWEMVESRASYTPPTGKGVRADETGSALDAPSASGDELDPRRR